MRKMKTPPRKTYQFRLSESEIAALDAKAASAGLDRSKYLRQAIAGSTVLNRHVAHRAIAAPVPRAVPVTGDVQNHLAAEIRSKLCGPLWC